MVNALFHENTKVTNVPKTSGTVVTERFGFVGFDVNESPRRAIVSYGKIITMIPLTEQGTGRRVLADGSALEIRNVREVG